LSESAHAGERGLSGSEAVLGVVVLVRRGSILLDEVVEVEIIIRVVVAAVVVVGSSQRALLIVLVLRDELLHALDNQHVLIFVGRLACILDHVDRSQPSQFLR
jgi:hypothetical protein